jgi:AcrR family transcriptional regulator
MAPRTETYERIVCKADELFRRLGSSKTTVADIARELGMSPANIYKCFPSKRAVIEAVGERRTAGLRQHLTGVTRSRKPAWKRIEDLVHAIADFFHTEIEVQQDRLEIEIMRDLVEMELVRHEAEWCFIAEFHAFLRTTLAKLIREGVEAGEMRADDPEEAAAALLDSLIRLVEPLLLLRDPKPLRDQRMERQLRFLARALV